MRQRPGESVFAGPVRSSRISRQQLLIQEPAPGTLCIRNIGKRRLLHQGRLVNEVEVSQGDVIEIEQQLVLLCTQRPAVLPVQPDAPGGCAPEFGDADAHGIIGESCAVWTLRRQLAAAAAQDTHILVQGPSGAGKELVARAIHSLSPRRQRPLVARSAATIPETLIDAEFFGSARHYPNTGAPERPGLIGEADGSYLFLDEIGELPVALQTRLLRVLDQGEYQRLGESRQRLANFRLLAATNRPLEVLRHDVLARFAVRLGLPGLDARPEDIPLIARGLLRRMAAGMPSLAQRFFSNARMDGHPRLSPSLVTALVRHPFETHIRELEYLLRRCIEVSAGSVITPCPELGASTPRSEPEQAVEVRHHTPGPHIARPPVSTPREPASREHLERQIFTDEERHLLGLQRQHRFNMSACGRDPEYPGVRQTAERHIRILLAKALFALDWQVAPAVALVGGAQGAAAFATLNDESCARVQQKLERFLESLNEKLPVQKGAEASLQDTLRDAYGVDSIHVLRVATALEEGRLASRPRPGPDSPTDP
ncbi:sigma 54-dependent Fis family transcriptional regulator [Pyxidicoccus trucidator]|uniref:sigma 54-dependent Fis family transcriptional regulator n=1 Tax=Pyxidicoccus trucidator TaxID=2709662 RepID=UPI0013DA6A96|nr:sigma 54-interacting transcriptional regulator [Pyxidicoccus trucidator]